MANNSVLEYINFPLLGIGLILFIIPLLYFITAILEPRELMHGPSMLIALFFGLGMISWSIQEALDKSEKVKNGKKL